MLMTVMGGVKEQRRSLNPDGEQIVAFCSGIELDLSQVPLGEATYISVLAVCSGVKLWVPRGTHVIFEGFALMGSRSFNYDDTETTHDRFATLYVNAVAVMGAVEVIEV